MNSSKSNKRDFQRYEYKRFCHLLGFKPEEISLVLNNIDDHYKEWTTPKIDKDSGAIKKYLDGNEKTRTFREPSELLKCIQKRIKSNILEPIKLSPNIHGGVKTKSNITNAKAHQGKNCRFTTDLKDFFPNISHNLVYKTFSKLKFSPHFCNWLTKLTTFKYELPQGSPTSTQVANLVFAEVDTTLIELCNKFDIKYTRYVDDLTFSTPKDFSHHHKAILKVISDLGFKINYRKTQYSSSQTITGIRVFLNKIDAPQRIIESARIESESNCSLVPYNNYLKSIRITNKAAG